MLTFKSTFTVFFIVVGLSNVLHLTLGVPVPWYFYFILVVCVLIAVSWGSSQVCSGFHFPVICKGNTDEKYITLTFDDGPDPVQTPLVLDLLKKHHIRAAFFLTGQKAEQMPTLVKQIVSNGHIIANHTYSHSAWFDFFSAKRMAADISKCNRVLNDITAYQPLLFRPPYGVTNPMLKKALFRVNLVPVGWNIRSYDTVHKIHTHKILGRVRRLLVPGSIILLHDRLPSTVTILPELIGFCIENGYTFVPLDELTSQQPYA
jgi:peptidoglycan/xylan/chitin deacetylase (PgdA/CDA1 family)